MSEPLKKSWLEAGAILYFEKQPDKPFIPRRCESFTSIAVYKADDVDVKLDAETARADRAEAACGAYAKALGDALSLARIPDHSQDVEWYAEFDRLVALEKQSHPGQRFLDLARVVEKILACDEAQSVDSIECVVMDTELADALVQLLEFRRQA